MLYFSFTYFMEIISSLLLSKIDKIMTAQEVHEPTNTINTKEILCLLVLSDIIFNIGLSLSLFVEASVQQFLAVEDHLFMQIRIILHS